MRIRPRGELRRQVNFYSSWLEIYDSTNSGVCLSYLVTLDFLQQSALKPTWIPFKQSLCHFKGGIISERIFNLVPTHKKCKIHFHIKRQSYLVKCKFLKFYPPTLHVSITQSPYKVHIFWEGHKILRKLHLTFVLWSASQK